MTKQKFYEKCILLTYRNALAEDEWLQTELRRLGDVSEMTFAQLLMKRELLGFPEIPRKQNFVKWGVKYLVQLLGFVSRLDDHEFTMEYFDFLEKNYSIVKENETEAFGEVCFFAFDENYLKSRDFCTALGSFMIFRFQKEKWFRKFLMMASNAAYLNSAAVDEYFRLTSGKTPVDSLAEELSLAWRCRS